ncbi:MAG: M20 family metallopeptidase, partial [Patescibacteria group bacterium]
RSVVKLMDTLEITKKLITIPSFVDSSTNEKEVAQWLFDYLKQFSWLTVKKQKVQNGRSNIIARDKYPTRVLVCDHIDTVQVVSGWKTDPFQPTLVGKKLYGLGASDTKGNVASLLSAIKNVGPTQGLMLLLYIDEEYDFAGAKSFVAKYKGHMRPEIIASADGGSLEIGNTCRGLIETIFTVLGQAGHSSNPANGKNAILGSFQSLQKFQKELSKDSTFNLAWINGGQSKPGTPDLGREGNVISDTCQFGIEIRNADPDLSARTVVAKLTSLLNKKWLKVKDVKIRHDLGAWITNKKDLKAIRKVLGNPKFTPAKGRGYVDLQMFWEAFGKPTCFTFGAGENGVAHKTNEYINIDKLEKGEKYWTAFIAKFEEVR